MIRASYEESRWKDVVNFDPDVVLNNLYEAIEDPLNNFAMKCMSGAKIVGFYVGRIINLDFSSTPIGSERTFYVVPESRGSRAAPLLQKTFYAWLKTRGATIPRIMSVIHHSADNSKTYRFCEKMGLKEIGRVFEGDLNVLR